MLTTFLGIRIEVKYILIQTNKSYLIFICNLFRLRLKYISIAYIKIGQNPSKISWHHFIVSIFKILFSAAVLEVSPISCIYSLYRHLYSQIVTYKSTSRQVDCVKLYYFSNEKYSVCEGIVHRFLSKILFKTSDANITKRN